VSWNTIETAIAIFRLISGSFCYALLQGCIHTIILNMNVSEQIFQRKLEEVKDYMFSIQIDETIQEQVNSYLHFKYDQGKYFDPQAIMKELNHSLQKVCQVSVYIYQL
jgi:hypothetical protein